MALEGIVEKLRETYFKVEDKWYQLIDKIDSKVPVHGFIDRVDNVFPSFALFLIIIILLAAIFIIPALIPSGTLLSFKISDSEGSGISGALVEVYVEGEQVFSEQTNGIGETGIVSVEPGSIVTIAVSKKDFQDYTETIELETSTLFYAITLDALEEKSYTVSLKDSLGQPIRQPLALSFACRNPDVTPPADITVSSGIATVVEPKGCNGLIVSVRGDGYDFKDSVELLQNQQTIYMQETVGETGTINVELYFNDQLVSEEITVYLYKDNGTEAGLGPIETITSYNGTATFEKQPDTYFAKTSGYGGYAATASQIFTLSAGDIKPVRIDIERNIVGTVRLKIVDEITNAAVDGANVLLRLGGQDIDTKISDELEDGIVEFPVSQDTSYTAIVDHEGYCLKVVQNVEIDPIAMEIELKPFDQDCGGELQVRVLDQGGMPVKNATVGLYSEDGFSIGFATLITDANGEAGFERVPSGDYKSFAFKESSSGWSDVEHFVQRTAEKTILTVVLIAGDGVIKVNVKDNEGNPLQFSQVAFIDSLTFETIGGGAMPVQDTNGSVELTTRADKRVYIVASKQGYTNFTSTILPVVSGTTQVIDAVLEREIIQGDLKLEFLGMYKNGNVISVLAPGQEYEALFQLRIPANKNYDSIGMHIRTGKNEIMELDKIVLKEINAPGRVQIVKATSYNTSNGYSNDSLHLSSDEAKWANLRWPVFSSGLMQVRAKVRIKETSLVGEQLNLFYRAWGEERNNYVRDPVDLELGNAESVSGKEGLYAKANQEIFQIGTETTCDGKFCFSASVLDLEDELSYTTTDSFSGKVFRPYTLNFTILNDSSFETDSYLDSEIRISNPDTGLLLQSYEIFGAQNQIREGVAVNNSTGWIETGNLLPNNIISGSINFTPEQTGLGQILLEVRSAQRIRFTKTLALSIASDKEMNVTIIPDMLPSGIENSITITAKNEKTNAEIDNAMAKVKDRFGTVIAERNTNKRGIAILKLPALQPGEKLWLTVGKADYKAFERELEVNPAVIDVKPKTIGVSLNAKTVFETQNQFSVENATSFDMKIKKMELNGRLYGLVDREKINNWLYAYTGEIVKAEQLNEMQLMTFLTEKGKKLQQSRQLEAVLEITMEAFGSEWVTEVPVKISIGLGGEVEDPTCFTITKKEWKASTEGVPIEIQFEAQNNCSISSAPVSLRNISAKAEWETNQVGQFSVRTETNAIDLRSGYAKKFAGVLGPEESIAIVLTFTPNPGVNGKGISTIVFSAENPTESGTQILEDSIAAEIVVVNLIDCIAFSKDILVIKPMETDSFAVDTIGCGISNNIRLESDLTISTNQFVLGETASQEVEVLAEKNIPGQYAIRVFAKGSDEVQEKLIKTIRARILSDGCLDLSRYEFDVFDNPDDPYDAYDTAELYNRCYDQHVVVNVKFDEHDWMEAAKTGALIGLLTGLLGGVSATMQGNSFFTGKPPEDALAAAGTGQKMTFEQWKQGGAGTGGITNTAEGSPFKGKDGKEYFLSNGKIYNPQGLQVEENKPWFGATTYPVVPGQTGIGQVGTTGSASTGIPVGTFGTETFTAKTFVERYSTGTKVIAQDQKSFTVTQPTQTINGAIVNGVWSITTQSKPLTARTAAPEPFNPVAYQAAGAGGLAGGLGGAGGGMAGGLGGMVTGMGTSLFGQPSFLGWGLMGFIGGTLWAYSQMEEGEFSVPTIQDDLVTSAVILLMPGATLEEDILVETESEDIIVKDLDETSTEPREDDPKLSMEKRKLGFLNVGGVVQDDPATPIYRILRIDGERIVWETEYELDEETTPELDEKERKDHKGRFRLQFNAFDPMLTTPEIRPIPNCTLGTVTGVTGPDAVPRVALDWSWSKIKQDSCDEGNEDYIYCDATQFSIAVLKKVQALKTFVETNKPFTCPSSSSAVAVKEQEIEGTAYDVAITKLQATKTGENDANIFALVESNNGQAMEAEIQINLKSGNNLVKSCTKNIELISKTTVSCEFEDLAESSYTVEASLTPVLCAECENNEEDNDSIDAQLVIGSTGIANCEPYTTKRLVKFLEASNYTTQQIEEVQSLINFNAYLIEDAYTKDFRADFDEFCKTKSFFDCPVYYLDEDGLHRFFSDDEKFKFDYSMSPHAPADAGKYAVTLNIEFDNANWDFFTNSMPDATVNVEMTELSAPEPNNPFYYLPFDGLVGVDSENGRQGYGVNFRQQTEETIKINNANDQIIISTNIAGSTPVFNGWIETGLNDQFNVLNQTNRGILLDVRSEADNTRIVLSPSYATPVMMEVEYKTGSDAFGFYSIEIDQGPQTSSTKMLPWSGIGVNCKDFKDNAVTEAWQDTWDKHGGISGNLSCAVGTEIADYGVEWCNPIRNGSVFLQSVVFTPQNKDSIMRRTAYADGMSLYNAEDQGGSSQISLNGVPGMQNNSSGTSSIDSIEDVFDLVRENKVCVVGQGSRISNKFFWNPKIVLEEISDLRGMAEANCITTG